MGKFFKKHQDWTLGLIGILFSALIIGYFVWGVASLGKTLNEALSPAEIGEQNLRFDFEEYTKLNLEQ